jgi:hypothetical protein
VLPIGSELLKEQLISARPRAPTQIEKEEEEEEEEERDLHAYMCDL